jgi:hypothetical protein
MLEKRMEGEERKEVLSFRNPFKQMNSNANLNSNTQN